MSVAGCAGGGSSAPAQLSTAALPLAASTQRNTESLRPLPNMLTGRIGLPASFRLPTSDVPAPAWPASNAAEASGGGVVYVSDFGNNAVYSYSAAAPGAPLETITSGMSEPLGNCVNPAGDLYVANSLNSTVTVYPKGKTAPSKTYATGLTNPSGCTLGADGTLYVVEFAAGSVVEFDPGTKKPSRVLAINKPEGAALDGSGNLYISYNTTAGLGAVEKYAPRATTGTDLGIFVEFAGDVKVDKAGDILVEDQTAAKVQFFKSGQSLPYGSISLGSHDAYKMALSGNGKLLYIATFGNVVLIADAKPGGPVIGTIADVVSESSGVSAFPVYVP